MCYKTNNTQYGKSKKIYFYSIFQYLYYYKTYIILYTQSTITRIVLGFYILCLCLNNSIFLFTIYIILCTFIHVYLGIYLNDF